MSDAAISLLILAVVVVLFVWNRLPVEFVAIGSALALYFTGVLTLSQSLAGFGDPAVILIAALFVVSEGLDATGVTAWVGRLLAEKAGSSTRRLLILTMLLSAVLTALIGLNGTVAALLPMVVVVATRQRLLPSRLLMPLAFAGSAGGMLLLTGSPVNVVISEAADEAGVGAFGFFEFALAGIPLVAGTVLVVMLLGQRLVPARVSTGTSPDLSDHAATLVRHYSLDNVFHLRLTPESTLIGRPRNRWDLAGFSGITVITVLDAGTHRPVSDGTLVSGDRVTVIGDPDTAHRFASATTMDVEAIRTSDDVAAALLDREGGAAEIVIPPRSRFTGRTVHPGMVLDDGQLTVLAVHRQGKDGGAFPTSLRAGDVLLVEGNWDWLQERSADHDLLVVDAPQLIRRQAVPLGAGSTPAIAILVVMVILLATGITPPVIAGLLAAGAMILFRVLSVEQAYRGISWTTALLIAGMIPMSTAITQSGAGQQIAELLVSAVGDAGPLVLLVALCVMTVVFGQLISNTATALIMIPIAVSAAAQFGISAQPVLMSVCVAASAAFLTPVATPANLMVMGPAGYRFGDYWKLGLPLIGVYLLVAIGLVPLIWHF